MSYFLRFYIILSLLFSPILAGAVEETNAQKAEAFLHRLTTEIIDLLEKDIPSSDKDKQLNNLFNSHVNTPWMARFVLGKYWNMLSESKREHFITIYHNYLTTTYLPKLKNFTGSSLVILGSGQVGAKDYIVYTKVDREQQKPLKVDYRLREEPTSDLFGITDLVAEGVSLLNTQRTEFSSIIEQNGIDYLMNSLENHPASATPLTQEVLHKAAYEQ